ncbi:toll/interleukin-1 receptor domain-containing protein [Methylomonas sp. 2BW1-5-20]|uniref:toll/interleukin-1 receptor domain-containing protein n=1 Tax=Methylomonas sp. 2BW1-5-20 TaxID=3376686 RepID=UPI004051BDC1
MAAYPIHAYLSYRCALDQDKTARDKLKGICEANKIALIYDEVETQEGDSLIKFMDDLTSARFVFLFLGPDYFKSAYTLYELVKINEWADIEQRFILPIRISQDMVTYQWTSAKNYFDQNPAVQNELTRLLKVQPYSANEIWLRIDKAWNRLIFPYLDNLHTALTDENSQILLADQVKQIQQLIEQAIADETQTLQIVVTQKIVKILNRKQLRIDLCRDEMDLSDNAAEQDVAKTLVAGDVGTALVTLTRVIKRLKILTAKEQSLWQACCLDAEQLCGWLLLNSVDPAWWYHNQQALKKSAETGINQELTLDDPAYYEVIVSRSLKQCAQYTLSDKNKAKPAGEKTDFLLFDAISPDAPSEQLLQGLYTDVYGKPPPNLSLDDLKKHIVERAGAQVKSRLGKPLYYLVSKELMNAFIDCFAARLDQLKGVLQFICCEQANGKAKGKACREDQTELLEQVAYLLSLINEA